MKKPIFYSICLAAICLFAAEASAQEQDVITRAFSSKPGARLFMKVDRGTIDIRTHSGNSVDVKVAREIPRVSAAKAKEIFEKHEINFEESADGVQITAQMPRKGASGWLSPANRMRVTYTISVPERYDLDVSTSGGDVRVADLEGTVACATSGGSLRLGSIKGPIKGRTSGGSIHLESTTGDADVRTSGGDIRLGAVAGRIAAKTSGGSIKVDEAEGEVDAETSGGNIQVKNSAGPVNARTSGGSVSVDLAASPKGDCHFKTSGGNVDVTLPETAAITLAARTSGGGVDSDFPGEFNKRRDHYNATLNGGGPEVVLETSGGSIHVRRR